MTGGGAKRVLLPLAGMIAALIAGEALGRLTGFGEPNKAEKLLSWLSSERPVFQRHNGVLATDPDLVALNNPRVEFSLRPSSGTVRIICLGDSTTRGWPYHGRGSYPAWLQAMLTDIAGPVEVVNAGFHSFDSWRVLRTAQETARYGPSIMIFRAGFNDASLYRLRRPGAYGGALIAAHEFLTARSRFYNMLRRGSLRPQPLIGIQNVDLRPLSDDETRDMVAAYGQNVEAMIETARRAGATPVFLTLPFSARFTPSKISRWWHWDLLDAELRAVAGRRRAVVVPLGEVLDESVFVDADHLDAEGYRRVALAVSREPCNDGLLGSSPCRWKRLQPASRYESRLGLDDGEYLAHVHVGLALMHLSGGKDAAARADLLAAERAAPNPDMVYAELEQFRSRPVFSLLAGVDAQLGRREQSRRAAEAGLRLASPK